MIKANELRIGNLVKVYNYGTANKPVSESIIIIKSIDEDGINPHMAGEFDNFITNDFVFENPEDGQREIFPIILTEEWLVKFGFAKEGNIYRKEDLRIDWHSNLPMIRYKSEDDNYEKRLFELRPIKFVHELQNLFFVLTGYELEVPQNDR